MEMNRTNRSVVRVRRWLRRAKQDLELVPAVYLLIRLAIEFYAAKALRSTRARAENVRLGHQSRLHITLGTNRPQDRENKNRLRQFS